MRTKTLSVNQRIKIGEGYAAVMAEEITKFATVLAGVGLTLEVAPLGPTGSRVILYAARRPVSHDVFVEKAPKAAPATDCI